MVSFDFDVIQIARNVVVAARSLMSTADFPEPVARRLQGVSTSGTNCYRRMCRMENSTGRRVLSRFIHWIGEVTSRAFTVGVIMVGVVIFLAVLAIAGFPAAWENGFVLIGAVITLLMVFVIQHTQSRQQVATQLKLDELIRSAPRADDLLIHVESAGDDELIALDEEGIKQHSAIREDAETESDGDPEQPEDT